SATGVTSSIKLGGLRLCAERDGCYVLLKLSNDCERKGGMQRLHRIAVPRRRFRFPSRLTRFILRPRGKPFGDLLRTDPAYAYRNNCLFGVDDGRNIARFRIMHEQG